jgi:Tfp pilus assembly protein PilV
MCRLGAAEQAAERPCCQTTHIGTHRDPRVPPSPGRYGKRFVSGSSCPDAGWRLRAPRGPLLALLRRFATEAARDRCAPTSLRRSRRLQKSVHVSHAQLCCQRELAGALVNRFADSNYMKCGRDAYPTNGVSSRKPQGCPGPISRSARKSWRGPAGASPAQVRGSARLVASVAHPSVTGAKRTQQSPRCMDPGQAIRIETVRSVVIEAGWLPG